MNRGLVDRIVAATLYEGYILYPYRQSSVKNQVRWTFGGVHPRAWSEANGGVEPWQAKTELLLRGGDEATVEVWVRFLHLVQRSVRDVAGAAVGALEVDGVTHRAWQEAQERDLSAGTHSVASLLRAPTVVPLQVGAREWSEPLSTSGGTIAGAVVRRHTELEAEAEIGAESCGEDLVRVRVLVRNLSRVAAATGREEAMLHSLVSTHVLLGTDARWLSLADPPAGAASAARACVNTGLWPVLVDDEDSTVLASPIILEDHPQVAAESPGDLYDSTEIDEILSLRILTLSDAEKAEMRASDERARALLERTEALTAEDFMQMHGAIRGIGPEARL